MKALLERELKLAPPDDLDLSGLEGERTGSRVFESTYHDTAGRDLLRRGVTLRRRVEDGRGAWQLKLPSASDEGRFELELDADGEALPDEALRLVEGLTRRRVLVPVACLRTSRETFRVRRDELQVADIVVDAVTVLDGERVVAAFDELEVELIDGSDRDLRELGRALRAAGARSAPGDTKLARALGLFDGAPPAEEAGPSVDTLGAALAAQVEQLLTHDPGTRAGIDAEDLHQFRVATRRLRAFLRGAGTLVDREWADGVRAELGWLGGLLGGVRDLDVLLEHLRAEAGTLEDAERETFAPMLEALEAERETARGELLAGLRSDRYFELLDRLEAEPARPRARRGSLRAIWRREFRRAGKAIGALGAAPSDAELHDARIRVKRARYAAELAAPELGKQGAAFVQAAKTFQDVLGTHQDAVVAEEVLRRLAAALPEAALPAGRLIERERARRVAARAGWRRAWAALERRGRALGG